MGIPGFPCAALAGCAACKRVANVVLKETMRPKYTEWQGPTLFVARALRRDLLSPFFVCGLYLPFYDESKVLSPLALALYTVRQTGRNGILVPAIKLRLYVVKLQSGDEGAECTPADDFFGCTLCVCTQVTARHSTVECGSHTQHHLDDVLHVPQPCLTQCICQCTVRRVTMYSTRSRVWTLRNREIKKPRH